MTETIMTLSRLNCNGCVRHVTQALQACPGVEILQTDIPTKTLHLRYSADQVSLEQMKAVLAEARYPVVAEESVDEKWQEQREASV